MADRDLSRNTLDELELLEWIEDATTAETP